MENINNDLNAEQNAISTTMLNQNVTVLSNAAELAIAVIASVDSDLVQNRLNNQELTLALIRDTVFSRLQANLGIRS